MDTRPDTRELAAHPASGPAPADPTQHAGLKGWIVKATGALLVVPALLNAGFDVYAAALKLPRTDAERINTELFRKYFNKAPLATLPVPIRSDDGTVDARFAVYEDGEIYVEFGKHGQWFPFPKSTPPKRVSLSLIASAYAQAAPAPAQTDGLAAQAPIAAQDEVITGRTLTRSLVYADGRTEQRKIDTRSGSTISIDYGSVAKGSVPARTPAPQAIQVDPIDLRKLRAQQQAK